jgi:hypothetical protein
VRNLRRDDLAETPRIGEARQKILMRSGVRPPVSSFVVTTQRWAIIFRKADFWTGSAPEAYLTYVDGAGSGQKVRFAENWRPPLSSYLSSTTLDKYLKRHVTVVYICVILAKRDWRLI